MKKLLCILLGILTIGCTPAKPAEEPTAAPVETTAAAEDFSSLYQEYTQAYGRQDQRTSWTAGVKCTYERTYNNDSNERFEMDGVLEIDGIPGNPEAHYTQSMNSDGVQFQLEGDYYGGVLYNTYNGVSYYEEHTVDQLFQVMLVPLHGIMMTEEQISAMHAESTAEGTEYVFELTDKAARALFLQQFDISGLSDYPDTKVSGGIIRQRFGNDGFLNEQTAEFHADVTVQDVDVSVDYSSSAGFVRINTTDVVITDEKKAAEAEYVSFLQIDTNAISEADITADTEGATPVETFQKRLISRLKYTEQDDGTYKAEFNEHETYTVDFTNKQFIYTNYSSRYVYNWSGDTGFFGTYCNYDFGTGARSGSCQDSAVEMIQNVKLYLQMELYYCGLSLDELQTNRY